MFSVEKSGESVLNTVPEASTQGWLDFISILLQDETQYITWFLVLLGWLIAFAIAKVQARASEKLTKDASHNEWVREFREKLAILEDESLDFWVSEVDDVKDNLMMTKLTRGVKELTTIAREIQNVGGTSYQSALFKELRRSVTNDSEVDNRPLDSNHYRMVSIRTTVTSLRRQYKRT